MLKNTKISSIISYPDFLTESECNQIISVCLSNSPIRGLTEDLVDDVRRVNVREMIAHPELMNNIMNKIWDVNQRIFNYDIEGIPDFEEVNFFEYNSKTDDKYDWHHDIGSRINTCTRKISFSLQLSKSEDYEGGDLLFIPKIDTNLNIRKQGTLIIFPSWATHCITPITSGTRYAMVSWVHGPSFK